MGVLEKRLNGLEAELKAKTAKEEELSRGLNDLKLSNDQYRFILNEKNEDKMQYCQDQDILTEKVRRLEEDVSAKIKLLAEQEIQLANLKNQLGRQCHLLEEMRNQENCYKEEIELLRKENDQIKEINFADIKEITTNASSNGVILIKK